MRSRALVLALGVFILTSSAFAAPKSRRSSKPSNPPAAAAAVREPRAPSDRVRLILARIAERFSLIEYGDEMSPPKP